MSFLLKDQLVGEGYLSSSTFQNLILYNYTNKCVYEKKWTKETLESRGTIYDMNTGEIVARPFDKFFNLGEGTSTIESMPALPFSAEEKIDGSMGTLYQFPGQTQWRVATRGSFYSDQAAMAEILLEKYNMAPWPIGWTPIVEIIYPENRIIIDYGQESKLVLISARNIKDGRYMDQNNLDAVAYSCGFPRPAREKGSLSDLIELAKSLPATHEGWVLTYLNGFKVKVKGARYLALARFKANLSPLTIWEVMLQGPKAIQEFMARVPEELEREAQAIYASLLEQFNTLLAKADERAAALGLINPHPDDAFYKTAACCIQKEPEWMRGYLFQRMRGREGAERTLLAILRPKAGILGDISAL